MLDTKYQNILVAIDGSDESERALREAVSIAKRNNSKLFIAHISDTRTMRAFPDFDSPNSQKEFVDYAHKAAEVTLNIYKDWAIGQGIEDVETILKFGSPKVEIAKAIPIDYKIDLILLGATGLNAVERLLIGSVSEYVVRHAICDVLIIRSYDEEEEYIRISDLNLKE